MSRQRVIWPYDPKDVFCINDKSLYQNIYEKPARLRNKADYFRDEVKLRSKATYLLKWSDYKFHQLDYEMKQTTSEMKSNYEVEQIACSSGQIKK
jgi:hypothetical protein